MSARSWQARAAYGLLGAPLAMAALPLFVQLPAYYSQVAGVPLAALGWVLFAARALDMLQDPLLGYLADRAPQRRGVMMWGAALLLALCFAALWQPPASAPLAWLGVLLVLAYGAHSLLQIVYLAWGARLASPDGQVATGDLGAAAWREGAGLAGVIVASVLPVALIDGAAGAPRPALGVYSAGFAALLFAGLLLLVRRAPRPAGDGARPAALRSAFAAVAANRAARTLLLPYFLNALAVAIPATLALFYIRDQLQGGALAGAFLAAYFLAAACALPLWTALARRIGPLRAWRRGMLMAIAGFMGATLLGPGDHLAYLAICVAAGAALGADLALPPVLLARAIGPDEPAGAYFGVFTLLGKLALALSGLVLPLLARVDYRPGMGGAVWLVAAYAALPCLLKLAALAATYLRAVPASRSATTLGSVQ